MTVNDGFMPCVWQWTATVMKRPRKETGNVSCANSVSLKLKVLNLQRHMLTKPAVNK